MDHSQRMLEGFITKQDGVAVLLYFCVWEVLGSDLTWDTSYPDCGFL
jgi:hypothetical protein